MNNPTQLEKRFSLVLIDDYLYPAHNYEFGCRFCGQCSDRKEDLVHLSDCIVLVAKEILNVS